MPLRTRGMLAAGLSCVVLARSRIVQQRRRDGSPRRPPAPAAEASKTFTVGVLTDLSGPAASEFASSVNGVKAGVGVAATEGYRIKYVLGDSQTTTTGVLAEAQKMVQQDHVFAVIALSALTFAAAPYLTSNAIPVVGADFDASEWLHPPSTNMFSVIGNLDFTKVYTTDRPVPEEPGGDQLGHRWGTRPRRARPRLPGLAAASAEAQGHQGRHM